MSTTVIQVENVSKQYRLGKVGTGSLSHDLNRFWHTIRGKEDPYLKIGEENDRTSKGGSDYVWALRDVNFKVDQGEVLGIIGRNGAGKSTLLKILSRTTTPTTGSVKVKGRIASLLEVGTGFHPELSGRDNIFLNGAILGMTTAEIKRKFDEIVDFAGVERYIDTPVKRYSSGMYVRLAFAVAAHLEPEILIVDEVLAVGDAEFQKKCLGKMKDVSVNDGRTVLFVSHNMAAVQNLCTKALYMEQGKVVFDSADVQTALNYYLSSTNKMLSSNIAERKDRDGNGDIRIKSFDMLNQNHEELQVAISGSNLNFRIGYEIKKPKQYGKIQVAFSLTRVDGFLISVFSNEYTLEEFEGIAHDGFFECNIPRFPVDAGEYLVNLILKENGEIVDWVKEATSVKVETGDYFGTGKVFQDSHRAVFIDHNWKHIDA